jgi:hypothetical protein
MESALFLSREKYLSAAPGAMPALTLEAKHVR